jgi:hypothetical protein
LLVTLPSPYPGAPNSSFFHCFHLGLTFESIKELGSALDNKNKYFLAFLSFLIAGDVFEEVQLGFFVMGHTHENIDGCFGYLSKKVKEQSNYYLANLMKAFMVYQEQPFIP